MTEARRSMGEAVGRFRERVVQRVLRGPAKAAPAARRAAFDNDGDKLPGPASLAALVDKVARHAWTVTDHDVAAARAAGVSEDEIFELAVCAALGQSTRQLEAGLAALDAAAPSGQTRLSAAAHSERKEPR